MAEAGLPALPEALLSALGALKGGVVALDGMCASGKSTLAARLGDALGLTVLHADDFFLQPHQRTPERLREAGGNFDRERFASQVLEPIARGAKTLSYIRYDCHSQRLLAPVSLTLSPVVLVEGAYSMHPALRSFYAFGIFLCVDACLQRERIRARNGEAAFQRFESEWIPKENLYFDTFSVREACRFHLRETGEEIILA